LSIGLLNIRSVGNKCGLIHDIIGGRGLDLFCITETWVDENAPPAVLNDMDITVVKPLSMSAPNTFEYIVNRLIMQDRRIIIISIYRPPTGLIANFLVELSTLFDAYIGDDVFVCGDFNCPGRRSVLDDYNITQHVARSTHNKGNILDLIATSEGVHVINDLDIRDVHVGGTDHYLITCRLSITFCERSDVVQLLRRAPIGDVSELSSLIRDSSLCVPLTGSVSGHSYCADLRSVIVSSLDKGAPLQYSIRCTRNCFTK